jgi:hypothetical protein
MKRQRCGRLEHQPPADGGMKPSPDLTRCAMRFFAFMSVYCLLFGQLVADSEGWRDGMAGASVANACAVLYLAALRRWGANDG